MSFESNIVSGTSVNGSGQTTSASLSIPAPKKSDEKMAQFVQNALVQNTLTNVRFDSTLLPRKEEVTQNVMSLATQREEAFSDAPTIKLDLTPQELRLINAMFQRWALSDKICLLELWGFDLYTDLVQVGKHLPTDWMEKILNLFCAEFAMCRVSICAESTKDQCPCELEFAKPGVKTVKRTFVHSRQMTTEGLSNVKGFLQTLASTKKRDNDFSSSLQSVNKKLELGKKLLLHPNAMCLLVDFNLLSHRKNFPKASALNNSSPQKTLGDLIQFVHFIDSCFQSAVKNRYLAYNAENLNLFSQTLAQAASKKNLFQAIKQFKLKFSPKLCQMQDEIRQLKIISITEPDQRDLSKLDNERNPQYVFSYLTTTQVIQQFHYDFLDILDEQVMEPLYPGLYIPTTTCFRRLKLNLAAAFRQLPQKPDEHAGKLTAKTFPTPPTHLSQTQQSLLTTILSESQLTPVFLPKIATLPRFTATIVSKNEVAIRLWTSLFDLKSERRLQHDHWFQYIQELQPYVKIITNFQEELVERRRLFLSQIEKFLCTLDRQEISSHRQAWSHYFKEFCFQESLDVCRWIMIVQDIQAISQLHVNMNVVNSEEHLLPEPLVDFMELEGIEELFNKLLYPNQQPMHEDLFDKPVRTQAKTDTVAHTTLSSAKSKTNVEKVETKKNAQIMQAEAQTKSSFSLTDEPLQVNPPLFSIRRGEKTRRILSRLRELGFFSVSTRGSHLKLEDEKGQTVIVSKGGKRKHQKQGTARSISLQVNGTN